MAVTFNGGVVLGADSRTTTGSYIANRVTDKLTQVADTIWCCRYAVPSQPMTSFTDSPHQFRIRRRHPGCCRHCPPPSPDVQVRCYLLIQLALLNFATLCFARLTKPQRTKPATRHDPHRRLPLPRHLLRKQRRIIRRYHYRRMGQTQGG
jgi:hypothetical protein